MGFISLDDTHDRDRTFSTSHENRWRVVPFAALLAYLTTANFHLNQTVRLGQQFPFVSNSARLRLACLLVVLLSRFAPY